MTQGYMWPKDLLKGRPKSSTTSKMILYMDKAKQQNDGDEYHHRNNSVTTRGNRGVVEYCCCQVATICITSLSPKIMQPEFKINYHTQYNRPSLTATFVGSIVGHQWLYAIPFWAQCMQLHGSNVTTWLYYVQSCYNNPLAYPQFQMHLKNFSRINQTSVEQPKVLVPHKYLQHGEYSDCWATGPTTQYEVQEIGQGYRLPKHAAKNRLPMHPRISMLLLGQKRNTILAANLYSTRTQQNKTKQFQLT